MIELSEYLIPNPAKPERIMAEWGALQLPDILREAACWIARQRWEILHDRTTINRIWSSVEENKRLGARHRQHPEWRAIDIEADGHEYVIETNIAWDACRRFPCGAEPRMRRVAIPLDHGTGPHYHVQATTAELTAWKKQHQGGAQ